MNIFPKMEIGEGVSTILSSQEVESAGQQLGLEFLLIFELSTTLLSSAQKLPFAGCYSLA